VPSFTARTIYFTVMGFCSIKVTGAYSLCAELCESRHIPSTSSVICTFDSATLFIVCFYFLYVDKDWLPLNLVITLCYTVAAIAMFFMPESPKWLIS
jgi:hypothetical protein